MLRQDVIIIVEKDRQCKDGRKRLTPYQSKNPNQRIPTHWNKDEEGKTAEDKKGTSS